MINLKFTARGIAELEDETDKSIFDILTNSRLSNLGYIICKGTNVDKEDAFKKIDEYLVSGKTTEELYLDLMEALQKDGFLSKRINFEEMRKDLDDNAQETKKKPTK